MSFQWKPYVPVAERRIRAEKEMQRLKKKGHPVAPVVTEGRVIARTFWGKAWCDNLEQYSDYANRLPRGRTYVRNGSVVDLQIGAGQVSAWVSGSELYKVRMVIKTLSPQHWMAICDDCSGRVQSLVELLQGTLAQGVMERLCDHQKGLFPSPQEIEFSCSCPDWAGMCKHVAAVFYGIGTRLDTNPELLFSLRHVDHAELIAKASHHLPLAVQAPADEKLLSINELSDLFGLDLDINP